MLGMNIDQLHSYFTHSREIHRCIIDESPGFSRGAYLSPENNLITGV